MKIKPMKLRLVVSINDDDRAVLLSTAHVPFMVYTNGEKRKEVRIVSSILSIGPEGSGASALTAFEWANEKLRKLLEGV